MAFEYKVVNSVEEANQLSDDGFELFTILPPGPSGGPDRLYLRRENLYLRSQDSRKCRAEFPP
jgi:hypothetical protein